MQTIVLVQGEPGVGKTTLAVNLAVGLAVTGRYVLLMDLDPQGGATEYLAVRAPVGTAPLSAVLTGEADLLDAAVTVGGVPNLSVVPRDPTLSGLDHEPLAHDELDARRLSDAVQRSRERWMDAMRPGGGKPDAVLIDTPPDWGILTVNALCAAIHAIVPVETKALSLVGLVAALGKIEDIRQGYNPSLEGVAVVPSRVRATAASRECLDDLEVTFEGTVLPPVRECVDLADSARLRVPVARCAPDSAGAADLAALTRSVIERMFCARVHGAVTGARVE